ncbi:MAG: helix-turn-helix domain-containing protein [Muribaculaceae bacterium]|nr:helix-turn-helix domain-containing protein [Muribaculaceae bacterium]
MSRLLIISLLLFIGISFLEGCRRVKGNLLLEETDKECRDVLTNGNTPRLDSIAYILLNEAQNQKSRDYIARAYYYLGTYCNTSPDSQNIRLKNLNKALTHISPEDTLLYASIYNTKGLWALSGLQYDSALLFFEKALDFARIARDRYLEAGIESNLSDVYSFLNDTLGFYHTQRLYEFAKHHDLGALRGKAAYKCAEYLSYAGGDSILLERYLTELRKSPQLQGWDRVFKCNYLLTDGNFSEAKRELDLIPEELFVYVCPNEIKARLLSGMGKYRESNESALKTLRMYQQVKQDDKWPELYRVMARNYESIGQKDSSLRMLQRYVTSHDSVTKLKNGLQVHAYRARYELGQKEQEVKLARAETARMKIVIISVVVIVLMAAASTILYVRRIKRHHQQIVSHTQEALKREKILKEVEERTLASNDSKNTQVSSGPSAEKSEDIFSKITYEMEVNHIWADTTVTRETFADIVGCNRTYFSQVIKSKTGMNYSQFMNARRIHEAVKILGESSEISSYSLLARQLGFLSESTFYSAFKQIMGMTPARYHKLALENKK